MPDSCRYRASKDVLVAEIGDGSGVLLDLASKFYFEMNRTGLEIWKALVAEGERGGKSSYLGQLLADRFEVEGAQASADVKTLLMELLDEQLVEEVCEG